jgi:hypothetical protein
VPRLPRVISPVATLFTRDGIDVLLVSLELWPQHVVVRLAGLPNEITDDQERRYELEFEHWGRTVPGNPPEQPGTRLLGPLRVTVDDDARTTYTPRSAATGGSGSEWHGDWFFAAAVPETVRRLTVRVDTPNGEAAAVDVDLAE